jgi:uncharacterized membrane protein YfcA
MAIELLIWFILLSLLAEIIGTVGGFGSSLFFVPMAGFFLDFESVLGITAIFHVLSNVTKIAMFRKGFDKKLVLTLGIPAVILAIVGSLLSKYIDKNILEIVLGIFLILISLLFLIFRRITIRPTLFNSILGGSLSGMSAGLLGTGGAIRGLTLAAFNFEKSIFIATSAIIDLGVDISRSGVYIYNGFVHIHDLYLIPILLIVSIAGTYIGKLLLGFISEKQFKLIVLSLILIIGALTIIKQIFPGLLEKISA